MNLTSMYIRNQPKPTKQGHTGVACPVCGGLQCLCRPRFFAGQLLTDEDLNRLDHYIVAKNRLHNRYLHGWGVVCGLDVVCHPCEEAVIVRPGYALSPCGDDIVVCEDARVDICRLIRDCRDQARRQRACEPYDYTADDRCRDLEEEWTLAICYDEKPARGITALRGGGSCSCGSSSCGGGARCTCGGKSNGSGGCSCGGAGGGSCSCGGHNQPYASGRSGKSAVVAAQCEPTVICEGFRFALFKEPVATKDSRRSAGEMVERFRCCMLALSESVPPAPNADNRGQWHRWCCDVKAALREFFAESGIYHCELDERLATLHCPDPNQVDNIEGYTRLVVETVTEFAFIAAEYLRYCLCSALLPPCPGPEDDNCVPLAKVTVRRADCHIVRICVLEGRKFAVTWPAIGYWLSPLQLDRVLEPLIEVLCCRIPDRDRAAWTDRIGGFRPSDTFSRSYQSRTRYGASADLRDIFAHAFNRKDAPVETTNFVLDMFGALDTSGKPMLRSIEREYPLQSLLANQLLVPFADILQTGVGKVDIPPEDDTPPQDFASMAEEVAALRALVREQQKTLDELRRRMDG